MRDILRDFKPALLFLAKFLGIYFLGNTLYGIYIESCGEFPDVVTRLVSGQTSFLLRVFNENTSAVINTNGPTVFIVTPEKTVLSIFEGCNGINVVIVFVSFMVAFGGPLRKMILFIGIGIATIHLFNIVRIVLLYYTSLYFEIWFYYFHKYLFTAILYFVVFVIWGFWILKVGQWKTINVKQ